MPRRSYSHRYGPHEEQVADLHGDVAPRAPVVVLIHGGFWRARYGKDLMTPLAEDLAGRGIAAWNVEFRRLDTDGGWPVTVQDVAASIDFLRDELGHEPVAVVGTRRAGIWRCSWPIGCRGSSGRRR